MLDYPMLETPQTDFMIIFGSWEHSSVNGMWHGMKKRFKSSTFVDMHALFGYTIKIVHKQRVDSFSQAAPSECYVEVRVIIELMIDWLITKDDEQSFE